MIAWPYLQGRELSFGCSPLEGSSARHVSWGRNLAPSSPLLVNSVCRTFLRVCMCVGHAEDAFFHRAGLRCGLVASMPYAVQRQQSPVREDCMDGKG